MFKTFSIIHSLPFSMGLGRLDFNRFQLNSTVVASSLARSLFFSFDFVVDNIAGIYRLNYTAVVIRTELTAHSPVRSLLGYDCVQCANAINFDSRRTSLILSKYSYRTRN